MRKTKNAYILSLLVFISLLLSFYFKEDSLGGGEIDYLFHEKFITKFFIDFKSTFAEYGHGDLYARNSPIFYIFLSFFLKFGLSLEYIWVPNLILIPSFFLIFAKCLKLKYPTISKESLFLLCSIIFLSPSIRTMLVWTYPFIWALFFFLISIYYYLKFQLSKDTNSQIKFSILNIIFIALSSYITPNFAIFSLFYFYLFLKSINLKRIIILLLFINIILAAPAFIYYYINDFYIFKVNVLTDVKNQIKYNLANKFLIILSLLFFYSLPIFLKLKFNDLSNSFGKLYVPIILFLICCFLFNFPAGFGGGLFYHFSNKILGNNYIFFTICLIATILFNSVRFYTSNNLILFFCLILFNPQLSIYHKYFDPLIYFSIFLLFDHDNKSFIFSNKAVHYLFYFLYAFFLIISLFKSIIIY